jgi:hypothetical protein
MPGIHFGVAMSEVEIERLAEQVVRLGARRLVESAFPPLEDVDIPAAEVSALAELHALLHLERAAHRLSERAAHTAARAGAGYPDLAAALAMTRQGARRRYPELVTRRACARPEQES